MTDSEPITVRNTKQRTIRGSEWRAEWPGKEEEFAKKIIARKEREEHP